MTFFTIQKDCKVVWLTGCPAWGYGACNASVPGISTRQHNLCGCGLCHFEWRIRYLRLSFRQGQGGKAYCNFKSFHNGCGNPVWDFKHCLFPLPD